MTTVIQVRKVTKVDMVEKNKYKKFERTKCRFICVTGNGIQFRIFGKFFFVKK